MPADLVAGGNLGNSEASEKPKAKAAMAQTGNHWTLMVNNEPIDVDNDEFDNDASLL